MNRTQVEEVKEVVVLPLLNPTTTSLPTKCKPKNQKGNGYIN